MLSSKAILISTLFALHVFSATIPLTVTNQLTKRIIPNDWYVCASLDRNDHMTVSYFSADIQAAINAGYDNIQNGQITRSQHGNQYPHTFHNYENILTLNRLCNPDALVEFPIVQNGVFRYGTDEGLDRVIFDAWTGAFCGVLTHRGERNNGLHPCLGHNAPVFDPPLAPPLILAPLPWMGGLGTWGAGSGGWAPKVKARVAEVAA